MKMNCAEVRTLFIADSGIYKGFAPMDELLAARTHIATCGCRYAWRGFDRLEILEVFIRYGQTLLDIPLADLDEPLRKTRIGFQPTKPPHSEKNR